MAIYVAMIEEEKIHPDDIFCRKETLLCNAVRDRYFALANYLLSRGARPDAITITMASTRPEMAWLLQCWKMPNII